MCGRFALVAGKEDIAAFLDGFSIEYWDAPRYNISPTQRVATVLNNGEKQVGFSRWGFIPHWEKAKMPVPGFINARAETLIQKASFKNPLKKQRCIILASGFYEWKTIKDGPKVPYFFRLKTGGIFAFAGLWNAWRGPDGKPLVTSAIITTSPNGLIAQVHNRMPVILTGESIGTWLDEGVEDPEILLPELKPFPIEYMMGYPVTPGVNSPAFDDPSCIEPLPQGDSLSPQ